jgi:hypothetical protein
MQSDKMQSDKMQSDKNGGFKRCFIRECQLTCDCLATRIERKPRLSNQSLLGFGRFYLIPSVKSIELIISMFDLETILRNLVVYVQVFSICNIF